MAVDQVLADGVLQSLRQFASRSSIYFEDKASGYVGAYIKSGFNTPLLMQVGSWGRILVVSWCPGGCL